MSLKLTVQQKAKPIYTAADHALCLAIDIHTINQIFLMREDKMRYFGITGVERVSNPTGWGSTGTRWVVEGRDGGGRESKKMA